MDELQQARIESIVELANDLVAVVLKTVQIHGDDPNLSHIVSAAFTLAIRDINTVGPGFTQHMIEMLKGELANEQE